MSFVERKFMVNLGIPPEWEVPEFECVEFKAKSHKFCVIVPVINEGQKFLKQIEGMSALDFKADIIIADGGSIDGSVEPNELTSRGVRTLLTKRGPGKLSAQLRMGFAYAMSQGYEGVVIIDGNGKDGYEAIPQFLKALDLGYDFIQGSRYVKGGKAINTPWDRHLGVCLIHAPLISLASRFRYTDTTNGFRGLSARLLRDPKVATFRDIFDTYNLHYYLAIRAARLGYRVVEMPVTRAYPAKGKTPTKISGMRGRLLIMKQLITAVMGGYNPKPVKEVG